MPASIHRRISAVVQGAPNTWPFDPVPRFMDNSNASHYEVEVQYVGQTHFIRQKTPADGYPIHHPLYIPVGCSLQDARKLVLESFGSRTTFYRRQFVIATDPANRVALDTSVVPEDYRSPHGEGVWRMVGLAPPIMPTPVECDIDFYTATSLPQLFAFADGKKLELDRFTVWCTFAALVFMESKVARLLGFDGLALLPDYHPRVSFITTFQSHSPYPIFLGVHHRQHIIADPFDIVWAAHRRSIFETMDIRDAEIQGIPSPPRRFSVPAPAMHDHTHSRIAWDVIHEAQEALTRGDIYFDWEDEETAVAFWGGIDKVQKLIRGALEFKRNALKGRPVYITEDENDLADLPDLMPVSSDEDSFSEISSDELDDASN